MASGKMREDEFGGERRMADREWEDGSDGAGELLRKRGDEKSRRRERLNGKLDGEIEELQVVDRGGQGKEVREGEIVVGKEEEG